MRTILRTAHKYLSLTFALLWVLQALTGVLISFRGEIEDAVLAGPARPLNPAQFGTAVAEIAAGRPSESLAYVMASQGSPNRYDLLFADQDGRLRAVHVGGHGIVLRERAYDYDYPAPGLFQTAHDFHETLFSGDRGKLFLGFSGALLLSNLLLGLTLAWPARGQWRRVLLPGTAGPFNANVYKWHRALGLMIVLPAIVIVTCGIAQQWPTDEWLGVESPKPVAHGGATGKIALGDAITTALAQHPGSTLAIVEMPGAQTPWYRIRVRQPGEMRRVFGTTTVYVDAHDGRVLLDRDAFALPLNERISNAFYPIHTGEFAGLAGRVVVLLTGLGLLGMATLGACLWWTRRRARTRPGLPLRTRTASR
jgi:uncharacterized iron-regulated membrane protein